MAKANDLVQGTLDFLILKTLSLEPKHGWAIAKRIEQISGDVLRVQQGSLYPALHRLERQGWIRARWAESETGREAKFYSLTAAGRTHSNHQQREITIETCGAEHKDHEQWVDKPVPNNGPAKRFKRIGEPG